MKRIIITAILILPVLLACNPETEGGVASRVLLSREMIDLTVGESATLTATVEPESLNMGVVWSVTDTTYASVDKGVVTAKKEGVTYVIATSADGYQKAACMVSVNPSIDYTVSVRNSVGLTLTGVYGYPGMSVQLQPHSSDSGVSHTYTWSVTDESAASITADGLLTLKAVPAADAGHVYDARSFIKLVTEDGTGCKIPIRSSLLKGVRLDGMYMPYAVAARTLVRSSSYVLEALYEGEGSVMAIPSGSITLEPDNTTDFTLTIKDGDYNLETGPVSGGVTAIAATVPGSTEKKDIARFKLDKYLISAQLVAKTSSSLVFTWTQGKSETDDRSKPYTISLFRDKACTDTVATYDIPENCSCWNKRQPRFVFAGLQPSTTYWFRVTDTSDSETVDVVVESPLLGEITDQFTIVVPSSTPASEGDVILAEDFSELLWEPDEVNQAAGFDIGSDSAASYSDRTANKFVATTGKYCNNPERLLTSSATARKEAGLRLGDWAQGYYARIYVGPGYVFLSTYKYATHIISSALNNIPSGKTAKVQISGHAAGYVDGSTAVIAVQPASTSFYLIKSNNQTNKGKVDLSSNVASFTLSGGVTNLQSFVVELDGLRTGDRIAFGPPAELAETDSNIMLLSDITVKILELN